MPPTSFSTWVVRPKDLLCLQFNFINVNIIPPLAGKPERLQGGKDAYMIVHIQTQHITEEAFFQASDIDQTQEEIDADQPAPPDEDESLKAPGFLGVALAGPSRIGYKIPALTVIPYTLVGLLEAMQTLPLSVTPVADYKPLLSGCLDVLLRGRRYPAPPPIMQPGDLHTAIEAPYRLILSPNDEANWRHAVGPITHEERTELWHTRLEGDTPDDEISVRAIWSPDYQPDNLQDHYEPNPADPNKQFIPPFRSALDQHDRNEIVHLTSNWHLGSYTPLPVDSEGMILTTLGSYLHLSGDWTPPPLPDGGHLTVEQWRNITTLGRDHYVRVMYAGYLFPFGHRASLVKVTERKFHYRRDAETPGMIAYLFQRMFIMVREPTRNYDYRHMPFRSVTVRTRVTPDLADPNGDQIPGLGQEAFWPNIATEAGIVPFQFHLYGKDWEGREVEFTAPLIFVSLDVDVDAGKINSVRSAYNGLSVSHERRSRTMSGQSVAFARNHKSGDTTLEAKTITFKAGSQGYASRHFRPEMEQAEVDIPAVQQMLGNKVPSTIEWETKYLDAGFGEANKGHVFVKNVIPTALEFAVDKVGGLVAPDILISGISRRVGPVGGNISEWVDGIIKPSEIFDLNAVNLLGGISLGAIISWCDDFDFGQKLYENIPKFITIKDGNIIRTSYTWKCTNAELRHDNFVFTPSPNSEFELEAIAEVPLDGSAPTYRTAGKLTNFSVLLMPVPPPPPPPEPEPDSIKIELVEIGFKAVKFSAENGKKPDVDVDLGEIEFKGILEYVKRLAELIPMDGFSDPPILDITSQGITVGFSLGLPTISVGAMSLQNMSFTASAYLPFVSGKQLNFHFAFCERHQPFTMTIYLFGGGGFFSIDIGISGIQMLEAAFEFGASVALDLGVASGKASIMGGFYFQMAGKDFQFEAYFRAHGSLSVLGIITVSCEFYLSLTYASKGNLPHAGTLWGQCSLKVKISLLFFSISVSVKMEREFAGSDPNFCDMLTAGDWIDYCDAFAADYPLVGG